MPWNDARNIHKRMLQQLIGKQNELFDQYQEQRIIRFDKLTEDAWAAYSEDEECHSYQTPNQNQDDGREAVPPRNPTIKTRKFHGILPRLKTIVVGVDIREYSRRSNEQLLFLTTHLYACIRRAIGLLQTTELVPHSEPFLKIQTGDGAFIVFSFLECYRPLDKFKGVKSVEKYVLETRTEEKDKLKRDATDACRREMDFQNEANSRHLYEVASRAFSFIFALNAVIRQANSKQRFKDDSPRSRDSFPTFPVECRFAVSYEDVFLLARDIHGQMNCVGNALVTCARILSSDHGTHLLVDHNLMRDLEPHGGLNGLKGGMWKQNLHQALLAEAKIKNGSFRYSDVFGFYDDGPLMQSKRQTNTPGVRIHIGSHDSNSVS